MIYLYIMDALRADHVNAELTPNIMSLARDSVRFSNAVSQATWSLLSMLSMMTGLYPTAIGNFGELPDAVKPRRVGLPLNLEPISSAFQKEGFHTAAYSANIFFTPTYGMDRGYDLMPQVYDLPELAERANISRTVSKRLGRQRELLLPLITSKDLNAIRRKNEVPGKTFNVIWAMDTHDPFYDRNKVDQLHTDDIEILENSQETPEKAQTMYREMVRYTDTQFSEFIDDLKQNGTYEDSFIVLCADHGESFGENEQFGHTRYIFEQQINVPLIVKLPGNAHAGTVSDELVALMDIVPTLADYYDLDLKQPLHGKSLLPVIKDEGRGHDYLFFYDQTLDRSHAHGGIRTRDKKYMFWYPRHPSSDSKLIQMLIKGWTQVYKWRDNGQDLLTPKPPFLTEKLYNLAEDPHEAHNLIREQSALTREMRQLAETTHCELLSYFTEHIRQVRLVNTSQKVEQRLRDLGYLE
ncbi:MAG: sulfatase-like hydrolase/transferase [Chloroflexi bacterium]|nr:sulfatase-like hydrolase/transferase [Chloroflexota bacterium]